MPRSNSKLKKTLGAKNGVAPMKSIPQSEARPGAWKSMLLPAPKSEGGEEKPNKNRHVPTLVDDQIIEDVANGGKAKEIEECYGLRANYVREVLIRKFGSIEGMKKALQAQCLENAIALGEYAMSKIDQIAPAQALAGVKLMTDSALSLQKNSSDRPSTVDFAGLMALGQTLERLEKRVQGRVIDV